MFRAVRNQTNDALLGEPMCVRPEHVTSVASFDAAQILAAQQQLQQQQQHQDYLQQFPQLPQTVQPPREVSAPTQQEALPTLLSLPLQPPPCPSLQQQQQQQQRGPSQQAEKRPRFDDDATIPPLPQTVMCMELPMPTLSVEEVPDLSDLKFSAAALNEPIVILRNMLAHPHVRFNNELFHYDSFDKAHLGESVNVLYQAVDPCGWNIEGQYWMKHTFSHYVAHMKRVDHQIRAFRDALRIEQKCSSEPQSADAFAEERSDLRTFLVLSQDRQRTVPDALQSASVAWHDMTLTDFNKLNKKGKASGGLHRRMKAVLGQHPMVQRLSISNNGKRKVMELGDQPYQLSVEPYCSEDETFLSVHVGESIVLLYGPLERGSDGELPFKPEELTVPQILEDLIFIWKNTQGFLNADSADKRSRQFDSMAQFCSNLDIGHWEQEIRALSRKLPAWMWCNSEFDVLGLLRQPVAGMNIPQLYVKSPGSWTGGHEENCRFRSVNCNHGPGCSEWYAVEAQYAPMLRARLLHNHGIDIYAAEGNWFPDPRWLDEYGIPYMVGIQRPGDVVILKGATLHWVRSLGCSTHSSWNFGLLEQEQLEHAMERYAINESVTPPIQSLVPMKMLIIDICRFLLRDTGLSQSSSSSKAANLQLRMHSEPEHVRLRLLTWLFTTVVDVIVEDKAWREYAAKQFRSQSVLEPAGALVVYCQQAGCVREITTAYFRCDGCDIGSPSKKKDTVQFMCMQCGILHAHSNKQHDLHFLHKDSIESLMSDLQQMMVLVASKIPNTPSLFANQSARTLYRMPALVKQLEAKMHLEGRPLPPAPPSASKSRGRPRKRALDFAPPPPPPTDISLSSASLYESSSADDVKFDVLTTVHRPVPASQPVADEVLRHLVNAADSNIVGALALINALHLDPRFADKQEVLIEAARTALHLRMLLGKL